MDRLTANKLRTHDGVFGTGHARSMALVISIVSRIKRELADALVGKSPTTGAPTRNTTGRCKRRLDGAVWVGFPISIAHFMALTKSAPAGPFANI